jgi:hypothetical protein
MDRNDCVHGVAWLRTILNVHTIGTPTLKRDVAGSVPHTAAFGEGAGLGEDGELTGKSWFNEPPAAGPMDHPPENAPAPNARDYAGT